MSETREHQPKLDVPGFGAPSGSSPLLNRPVPIVGAALMLALAAPMSSTSKRPEEYWVRVFDQSSTVHALAAEQPRPRRNIDVHALPSTAKQLATVHMFFGLSKTQLARVCSVQRQTVYDWYAGKFEADGNNARRLGRLYTLSEKFRAAGYQPLSTRIVSRSLSSGGTLLDLLSRDEIDAEKVSVVVQQLDELAASERQRGAAATRKRAGWAEISREAADKNLEANIEDLTDG